MRLVSLCPFPGNGREAPGISPQRVIRFHGLPVYWLNLTPGPIGWGFFFVQHANLLAFVVWPHPGISFTIDVCCALQDARIRFGYAMTCPICSNATDARLEHLFPA